MEEGKEEDVRPRYRIGSKSQMEHTQETLGKTGLNPVSNSTSTQERKWSNNTTKKVYSMGNDIEITCFAVVSYLKCKTTKMMYSYLYTL